MKKIVKATRTLSMVAGALLMVATSCKKENSLSTDQLDDIQAAVVSTQAVAVAAAASGDSVYIVNTCGPRQLRDSIAFTSLPASALTYLSTNYLGYTSQKAFTIKDASGTVQGYVAIIQFNGNPVGLKFDASGNFVSVLEQREGHDLRGHGWHDGGRFDHRDGKHRDTIALSALPTSITAYYAANYSQDTLAAAFKNKDGAFVVISRNNGVFATIFTAEGVFVSRAELPAPRGKAASIAETALPANVTSYLATTYPGYVFSKAFSITTGNVQGYVVIIEANSTRYALQFDASGNFVKARTIR